MPFDDLGKSPIAENAPTGTDVSGEPLYDELSAEIKKLSSPTAEGGIDWQRIEQLAHEILATRSKHVLVACCFTIARQHTAGWHGYADGVAVLHDLFLTYWDACFPVKKRMRGRKNAIAWWQEMTDSLIKTTAGEEWPAAERAALLADLEEIDQFLGENMEDGPLLRPTIQALAGHITEPPITEPQQAPAAPSSAPPAEPPSATPAQSSPPRQQAVTPPSEELPPEKNLALACDYLRLVSSQYLQRDPFHPLAFRLNRIIAWFPLDALPLADNGTTMVPPPDSYKISALQTLAAGNNWTDLLETAEQQLTQYLFWLDPQRHVATALERLGRDLARDGVVYETRMLLKRLSGLEKLAFSDGTPFADAATRDWLKELENGGQNGGGQIAGADQAGDAMAELVSQAQALATSNKLAEALQALQQGLETAKGGRSRLQWTLATCHILCRSGQPLLAAPFATTLLDQLDRHELELWEPALAEEVLVTIHQVLRLQEKDDQERMQRVVHRLTVLNPARALDLIS